MTGILNLNKPSGVSSRAVVDQVGRLVPRAKVGHAGTLDPLAHGVLVVCIGSATRLVECVQGMPKTYRAVILLGAKSDTLDADSQIEHVENPPVPVAEEIAKVLARQVGLIRQLPPQYSALKIRGQRAYDLARSGRVAELEPRLVRIDRVEMLAYRWPRLEIEIDCGGGTYIRSIARDVGEELGCGGLIESLCRTRIGLFTLGEALDPASLSADGLALGLRPLLQAVPHLPVIPLDEHQVVIVTQGRALDAARLAVPSLPDGEVALVGPSGSLVALATAEPEQGAVRPHKVLG